MNIVEEIVNSLWSQGRVALAGPDRNEMTAVYSRPADFFDIVISTQEEPAGFITLKYEGGGKYSIVNNTKVNRHPSFVNTPGHGLEVKNKFRKRGLGAALLSLGIGIAQRDYRTRDEEAEFRVVASDITGLGLGCYQNFGFQIKQGLRVSSGYYYNPDTVPELAILPRKVGFFKRLRKRLRSEGGCVTLKRKRSEK